LRECNHVIQYQTSEGGPWRDATGPNGVATKAELHHIPYLTPQQDLEVADDQARAHFMEFIDVYDHRLMSEYRRNDFGEWAFNLTKGGAKTPYFLHTTHYDEAHTAAQEVYSLKNSHGCIHIRPSDRARLMVLSCLRQGVQVEVKGYDEKGPPPGWGTTVLDGSPRACFEFQPVVPKEESLPHHREEYDLPGVPDNPLFNLPISLNP
jgi:hypothetical protein